MRASYIGMKTFVKETARHRDKASTNLLISGISYKLIQRSKTVFVKAVRHATLN